VLGWWASIVAIALGVLCRVTLFRGLVAVPTRLLGRPHHAR
jgi:hypothetical protein